MTTGLMLSGGLDSAILLRRLLDQGHCVQPFYVSTGCRWEREERQAVEHFLRDLRHADVRTVIHLKMPVDDLYGRHWSVSGVDVPDDTTPDEAVFLPGRNPLLLLKPMLWCGQHAVSQLAIATLAENPFADASAEFVARFEVAIAAAIGATVEIARPFAAMSKAQILDLASQLPVQLTFSCLAPRDGLHCGGCNKCAERARALQTLPKGDPTVYASSATAVN
ncbi:MAG: 7-cyano-7-deazaguanine synthase [Bythopirellula sp.]